jgi:hypothetical protein
LTQGRKALKRPEGATIPDIATREGVWSIFLITKVSGAKALRRYPQVAHEDQIIKSVIAQIGV